MSEKQYALAGSIAPGGIMAAAMPLPDIILHGLRITRDGITYKGEEVKDAGAAHAAIIEALNGKPVPTVDHLARACNLAGIAYNDFLRIRAYLPAVEGGLRDTEATPDYAAWWERNRAQLDGFSVNVKGAVIWNAAIASRVSGIGSHAVMAAMSAEALARTDIGNVQDVLDALGKLAGRLGGAAAEVPASAAQSRDQQDESIECWSSNEEDFNARSLDELLCGHDDLKPGDTVWVGDAVRPDAKRLINEDAIIEHISEQAYDIGGEHAEDYPNVTEAQGKELESLVADWIDRTCPPTFWTVENVRPYVLSHEDFPHDPTPIQLSEPDQQSSAQGEKGGD